MRTPRRVPVKRTQERWRDGHEADRSVTTERTAGGTRQKQGKEKQVFWTEGKGKGKGKGLGEGRERKEEGERKGKS